jgi:hypothetical protein
MNKAIKTGVVALLVAGSIGLGGCVYYPVRSGVAYADPAYNGNAVVDYDDSTTYYAPAYYGGGYYDPYWNGPGWYGYGWPAVSLGFYGGGYWGGHHYYHGPWRGGGSWGGRSGFSSRTTVPMSRGAHH